MIWARFAGSPDFHSISHVADSSATTYCRRDFSSYETVEVDPHQPIGRRCHSCVRSMLPDPVATFWINDGVVTS